MTAAVRQRHNDELFEEPSDDWVDEEIVRRALKGHPAPGRPLTHAERLAVARHIVTNGQGSNAIIRALAVNWTLARDLARTARHQLEEQEPA